MSESTAPTNENSDAMMIDDENSVQAAPETKTTPADKGKGKGKAPQKAEDEDESDESDEEEGDEEELVIGEEDLHALDTTAILPPGSRRRAAGPVDYTSPEALAKAGLAAKGDTAHEDGDDEEFTHRDDDAMEH